MTGFEIPFERISFRDGQVLAARDLRDDRRAAAWLRALHNRYVHQTWGVALGLEVEILPDLGGVLVHPGYAVDSEGRDVLVAQPATFAALHTQNPEDFVLVAAYGEASGWVRAGVFQPGLQVPLALAHVAGGKIVGPLDFRVRRHAARLARPHIGWGTTAAGGTGWLDAPAPPLWIEATVDTSEAGFMRVPQYFVALSQGDMPAFVSKASPHAFTYRVLCGTPPFGTTITASAAEKAGWAIFWIGLESGGCS